MTNPRDCNVCGLPARGGVHWCDGPKKKMTPAQNRDVLDKVQSLAIEALMRKLHQLVTECRERELYVDLRICYGYDKISRLTTRRDFAYKSRHVHSVADVTKD